MLTIMCALQHNYNYFTSTLLNILLNQYYSNQRRIM